MEIETKIIKHEPIDWRKAEWLQPEEFKEISEDSLNRLKQSIRYNGFIQPFNVWETDGRLLILDGHHRKKAMEELESEGLVIPKLLNANFINCSGMKEAVKFVMLYSSSYAHVTQDGINKFIEIADIDIEEIVNVIDIPNIEITLDSVSIENEEVELQDADVFKDKKEISTTTKQGDVATITLGNSSATLICGDCLLTDFQKILNGRKVNMCFTDPPYNVGYEGNDFGKEWDKIENDKMKPEDFLIELEKWFAKMEQIMDFGASIYVCYSYIYTKEFRTAFDKIFKYSQDIIWDKTRISFDRYDFHYQTEPIIYGWKKGAGHSFHGPANLNNIWTVKRPTHAEIHPTEKPLELIQKAIENSSLPEQLILDIFSGSGSTMITALQMGRDFIGTEIDPTRFGLSLGRLIKAIPEAEVKLNGEIVSIDDIIVPGDE